MEFKSKSETLIYLSEKIKNAKILPIFKFTVAGYNEDKNSIIKQTQQKFKNETLIVRSSALNEDTLENSNAGKFKSVLNIDCNDVTLLNYAIKEVIDSYKCSEPNNEILIQPMLKNINMCGVAFSADIDTLAPYYIINYDESGKSDTITGGSINNGKTYIFFKDSNVTHPNPKLSKLIKTLQEIESIFQHNYIDVEFAFNSDDELYIFQARPISQKNKRTYMHINLSDALNKIHKKIKKLSTPHPDLLGNQTIFGVMPDWNPAEIIGLKPQSLAISLYKELVTDNIWAYQRDNYGYRNLRSHPLMVSFLGVPFIDVRVDFNSFIPKNLNEKIAKKLVDFYLDKLSQIPSYHDKVEFEIVHSCYYLNLQEKLTELLKHGFNKNEIKRIEFSLLELTNKIIDPDNGLYRQDLHKIEILKMRHKKIIDSDLAIIDKIYWLIEDCKRYGTLPFAGIARAAFIAVQILKSFIDINIITKNEYNLFLNSLNTIAKKINFDIYKLSQNKISKEEFLNVYGHLRPGTYDILSLRYDENFDNYFSLGNIKYEEQTEFKFNDCQIKRINEELIENGIKVDAENLIKFIKESIEGREYSKFIFTKSLSDVLVLIEEYGNNIGISRELMAYSDIRTILNLYSTLDHRNAKEIFMSDIEKNKLFHEYTQAVRLPSLILNPDDIYSFFIPNEESNYITLNMVRAEIILEDKLTTDKLSGKIVFIKSADPGYDFLFTKNIAGLVTQFGGANSHMAIRCAELQIPAVIGCGEKNFKKWAAAIILEIDCLNKHVRIIS